MMTMLLKSILIFIFVVISISDWRTHKIPDRWNAGILLVAVLLALVDSSVSWQERILGMFAVSVPMACLLFFVPGSFGGGDIKFVAAVGAAIGVKLVVMGSAAAILLAGIYCIRLLAEKRNGQKTAFAFGPFLCMGMTAAWCLETHGLRGFYQDRLMSAKVLFQFLPEQFQLCFVISGFQFRECL